MVFESLVVDVLNRFLGDYVVNLDSSQLKLGIWGGTGLARRGGAASLQLDVPFKVKAGHISQLNLQIPWQNLYTQPVEAVLDGVYLLIVPTATIKYDAEKEAKHFLEARQRELQRIEEAKQKIADQDKVKEEKQDTFVEKLVTQVIKNLQLKISNIHIRYEDDVSAFVYLTVRDCLVRLDNLFAYWNVKSEMFYHGVFRPISAKAKLLMNPRSDVDFSSPKIDLDVNLQDITVEFNKPQYFSVMELLESIDMMTRNLPYRKYRPDVPVHNNAKTWWKYVIDGILKVNVQPKLQMWSWEHISHHRKQVKNYKELYKTKITSKKPNEEILKLLEVSNFLLKLMTQEEKAKLYAAIGYSETAVDPTLPKSYEAMKFSVNLLSMSISIRENMQAPQLIEFALTDLSTVFTQRPGAQAIRFETKIASLEVTGVSQEKCTPRLLSSRTAYSDDNTSLLSIMFETNPLDEKADQRIRIESQPLEIVYDAMTVNNLVDFFRPPKDVHLEQLTSATLMKLEEFREKTSTGLLYIIETQKILDLKINLMASYIIVPQKGFYDHTSNLLLLDLGSFKVSGKTSIEDIMSRAYDSFDVQLSSMQLLYSKHDENWREARKLKNSSQCILQPLDVNLEFSRAMVVTDARMPRFKLSGQLPLLSIQISDQKVTSILELIDSIPKPESVPATSSPPKMTEVRFSRDFIKNYQKTVLIKLCRRTGDTEMPVLQLDILGLGTELKVRTFDMTGSAFLRETDIKGPELKTVCQNVLQKIKVNFSSLDVHLHTEALLNAMNYLSNLLPKQETKVVEEPVYEKTEEKKDVLKKFTSKKSKYEDIIDLIICADLSCLRIFIGEENRRIAEIHIEGLDSQVIMKKAATDVTAKLKNITVVDSDEKALYKKALYITEKEVFNFRMVSYVNATDGIAYTNMDVVDNRIYLTVGCIQVVFVNKFVTSVLAFINNFQAAKEALTEATVRTAEKAATGVKGLAERSSRLALDINIKAPVVIIPQSAMSANVLVADLGLITVKNQFFIAKTKIRCTLPPVIDSMTVKLSELKLSYYEQDSLQTEVQLLQPINLEVAVERNLAAAWYHEVPDIEISGRLKPMNLILSQEDITTILRTLNENAGESSGASTTLPESKASASHSSEMHGTSQQSSKTVYHTFLLFLLPIMKSTNVSFKQVNSLDQRDDLLKLAEFKLVLMSAALKMLSDGSMNASVKLANCTLDDKRQSIQKATPRMVEMKRGFEKKVMVDVNYKQGRDGTALDVIVQEIYLCASMEFLLTVADIFLKANAESAAQRNLKQQSLPVKDQASVQPVSTMEMNIVVKNPEIVFVADLTRSDAPALVVTTQCEVFIKNSPERYNMTAAVREIQMKACPFLPEERKGSITTVLQPCDLFFEMKQSGTIIPISYLQVSPIIINTVITITSALYQTTETTKEEISQIPPDLWNKKDIKNLKMWFLEETNENGDKNPKTELVPTGESLKLNIESVFITLEAGVGHRTVPMLLAKSSFAGEVKNWSTLINLHSPASQTSDVFKKERAPFVIINSLGVPITVLPSDSFSVLNVEFGSKIFHLEDKESLNMDFVRSRSESDQFTAMTTLSPHNHSAVEKIPLTKVGRCIYKVRHEESGVERSIVSQIDTVEGSKMITIRSPIQIRNHFSIPLNVFEEGRCLGTASPANEFNIPFSSYRSVLSLQPLANENGVGAEFDMCEGITFDEIMKNVDSLLQRKCQSVKSTNHSLIINIVPVKDALTTSLGAEDEWDFPYVVHLWPSVLLRNLLPYQITYSVEIHNAVLDQTKLGLQLLNYLDQDWRSEYLIKSNLPDISFTTFQCVTELDKTELDIAVHVTYTTGQMVIEIHSPYWMVNKTGRMLQYKADGIHRKHPPDYKKPLLFSFQPKNFLQNNKAQLRVTDSELSDPFSLDTVGSHGSVKCKSHKKEYQVGITINNSSFNITRIVTFTPFFMISNRSNYTLEVAEEGKEKWIPIVLQQCIPFWPESDANKLLVRVENSDLPPKKINFDQQENCLLLHLDNKLGGIAVDVNLTEHSTVITFSNYYAGAAPFLLINHTKEEIIEYGQSSLSELEDCLQPNKAVLYTWADPTGSKKLKWRCGNRTEEIAAKEVYSFYQNLLLMVSNLIFILVYLMSFYEGLQRIVLFTEDENVFKLTYESVKAELAEQEIVLSLQDVGISLVNNYTKQEVSYIGITSSDVVWETKPKKKSRWRPMSVKQIDKLEQEFRDYSELSPSENKIIELESNVLVILIIQNQIPGAIFPFFYILQILKKYLFQMHLQLQLFEKDVESLQEELMSVSSMDTSQISLYEYFHISPIKLHLSFSLSEGGEDSNKEERKNELIPFQSLNLLLKSIGATLTDVQDIVFKLAFFELRYDFCTTQQLQSSVIRHYSKQAIKQMYILILGLDVLGNPFGFIRGLSEGVEAFFYEPYQGAIQGPEEFIEGMALGFKALVGGAVGGLAGAASRITGAMAKGVAAITMDEDYQQKRREAMNKQPTGLREGITRGGKGLVSGFVSGITGIVTKPIRGAQEEGAAGFFKGVGKGLVGAVARPTGGIIDMASSTFQGIKKVADSSEDVISLRPPRFFNEDGVIRPYRLRDGTGIAISDCINLNRILKVHMKGFTVLQKYCTRITFLEK
uniref:Vacuolar protein sorting 13 homolog A n=1 Tax=Zonotrichia albicollis TaxID=44394 RepID=A0A8D2N516_ZONAL